MFEKSAFSMLKLEKLQNEIYHVIDVSSQKNIQRQEPQAIGD